MNYTYQTVVRDTSADPTYTFAEVKYGRIVSINRHWVPLEEYKKFFEPNALFLDITDVLADGYIPVVGDIVMTENNGYRIIHYVQQMDLNLAKHAAIERIKLERDQMELEPIAYNNHMFDADRVSLERLDKARQFLEDNDVESILWTTADNDRVVLTVADFKGINTQVAIRSNALHVRYNKLKAYINALEEQDMQTVLEIEWDSPLVED